MTMLTKTVKREVRKLLGPTGLMGKRGPAKSVRVLVRREVELKLPANPKKSEMGRGDDTSSYYEIGGSR